MSEQTGIYPRMELLPDPDAKITPGRYGNMVPKTLANGMTFQCKLKPGGAEGVRKSLAEVVKVVEQNPYHLAALRLHYDKWVLFGDHAKDETHLMYDAIFDTDFDQYIEDFLNLYKEVAATGTTPVFEFCEGIPADWKEHPAAFAAYALEHQANVIADFAEYPGYTNVEVVKALKMKEAFSDVLDQMQ